MGCYNCKEKNKLYPEGNFKMRFIGKPNGKLLKGAPGNYIHGEIYMQPYRMSKFAFWELVEEIPELSIPPSDEDDSVFEEVFYVPDAEDASVELYPTTPPMREEEINLDPNTPASIEFYKDTSNPSNYETTYSSSTEPIIEYSREQLLEILESHDVEVKPRTRTTTLKKMVEELESKEES